MVILTSTAKSQSPKPSEAGVENYITDSFVKEGSLKAYKAEQDRLAAELDEEERLKAEKADKRAKSGKKVTRCTLVYTQSALSGPISFITANGQHF